jgi:transposase
MLNFGIDVSRDKLDCAVLDNQGQRVKRSRTFANDHQGVLDLIAWARCVAADQPRRIVMEATAAHHELAATRLHGAGLVVSVVNPAQVRSLARGLGMLSKTDAIDAVLLAHDGRLAAPRPWRPVRQDVQQFNAMLMRLDCIEADLRRERQPTGASRSSQLGGLCFALD